ncbi:MAG: type I restriction endonuclease [Gemmatimonadota bacterium]|nr:type I restriction endonuclease [Gemmatimonadota bacterium]
MSAVSAGTSGSLERAIEDIRAGFANRAYASEQAISQGVVLRLLSVLGWPVYDTQTVIPEYGVEGTRVDFALCHPPEKPIAFIEVKRNLEQTQREAAEKQLFQYAFHKGVPFAVLADGREWNFFLPSGHGNYGDRRVYKLDIVDREIEESTLRLNRYLRYDAIRNGEAIESIRKDYHDVTRKREIQTTLPKAWAQLVADEDDLLLDLLAEQVGKLCGYQPDRSAVAAFLQTTVRTNAPNPGISKPARPSKRVSPQPAVPAPPRPSVAAPYGFTLDSRYYPAETAKEVLIKVFEALMLRDSKFAQRFADLPKHGRIRRYLARDRDSLFPGRPDYARKAAQSHQLTNGWWLLTHLSRESIRKHIKMACDVAGLQFGKDLRVELGKP